MKVFDPIYFRQQFPSIGHGVKNYLDNAATTLKPQVVIDTMQNYYLSNGASVHRSQSKQAQTLTALFEQARFKAANFLHAPSEQNIIWTKGATEAINLIAQSYARQHLKPDDEILVSEMEHHANLIPWLIVAAQTGARVTKLPLTKDKIPDIKNITRYWSKKTKILAISQMSNVTGACPDLTTAIKFVHQNNAIIVVDGAQGAVHHPLDVTKTEVDFYTFSGHKLYGSTGIGVLYAKSQCLDLMSPWQGGGKMATTVSFSGFTPQQYPACFEAGTPNIAAVLGMGELFDWLTQFNFSQLEKYSVSLADKTEQLLQSIEGFTSYRVGRSPILAFNIHDIHRQDLATLLAEYEISLRSGQHCAQPLMQALNIDGCLRISFAPYNTIQEVEYFYSSIKKSLDILR